MNPDFDDIIGDTYQAKLDTLSNCNCCQRHQTNRPTLFSNWIELHPNNYSNFNSNICNCNCRHRARWICRQFVDELYEPCDILR